jgi:phage FluMu protein Com
MMSSLTVLFDASSVAIRPHTCPKCSGPMILTRIKTSCIGFQMLTFRGIRCHHVDKVVSETHSMKWINSGLRAPV